MNYISSAELARRCDVTRAAVAIAIRQERISPKKVRRAGGRVLVEETHGLSVLGHHRQTPRPPAPPAPAAADDGLADLLAWGAAPIMPVEEPDELSGEAEVADLEQQIEQWSELVQEKENLIAWWNGAYADFREWITTEAANSIMQRLEERPDTRKAVCDAIEIVQAQLRAGLDEVHYKSAMK
jgi:hypothetical protein